MPQGSEPIFYGLLYVDQNGKNNVNIRGPGEPLDIYLRCASLCARSIAYHGYRFRLVTNDRRWIERRIQQLNITQFEILERKFSLSVPENLAFRAAHFKLELYRYFGSGDFGDYLGIVDIDTVMTAPIAFPPLSPENILAYDITEQIMPEYGHRRVTADLARIRAVYSPECRWFGGEFLFGKPEGFRRLSTSVFHIWQNYINNVSELHHVGDEILVAAAMPNAGLELMDAGRLGFIGRWWTARTNFKQVPFDIMARRSLLHLPADKDFLAKSANIPFCPANFIDRYRQMARGKLLKRRIFNKVAALVGRRRKYVARLAEP